MSSCYLAVGVASDRNAKFRRFMEDADTVENNVNGDPNQAFFAVYDGHGGKTAALFCQAHLHKYFSEELSQHTPAELDSDATISEILRRTYAKTDDAMSPTIPSAGACAVTAFLRIKSDGKTKVLYVANAGDSRAVLCRNGEAVCLTVDHKANNEAEAQRVLDSGGFIKNDRVNGMIAISRALGDHCMKAYIISEPYVSITYLGDQSETPFFILACDGLWDVIQMQEAVEKITQNHSFPVPIVLPNPNKSTSTSDASTTTTTTATTTTSTSTNDDTTTATTPTTSTTSPTSTTSSESTDSNTSRIFSTNVGNVDSDLMAKRLLVTALKGGTTDNVTVMVVAL